MMKIAKVIIQTTVLLPADELPRLEGASLSDIEQETSEGLWIGMSSRTSVETLPPEKISTELKAIGNDGTFFDTALDESALFPAEDPQ